MSRQTAWKSRRQAGTATPAPPVPVRRRAPRESKPAVPPPEPRSGLRIAGLAATVLLVGLSSLAFLLWYGAQGDAAVPEPGPPAVAPASTFRVVYRVDDMAGPQPQVESDVITVRRPLDVRIEHWTGPQPGGTLTSGNIVDGHSDITLPDNARAYATPLTVAFTAEVYSADALAAAADAGKAEVLGEEAVLGQSCTRYSYRHSGTEALAKGNGQDHVVSCVTRDGIMLREAVTVSGREVRRAVAVQLERTLPAPATYFAVGAGEPSADVQATRRVIEGRPSGQQLAEAPAPRGFHVDRRLTDSRQEIDGPLLPFYLESFVAGGESVISEQYLYRTQASPPWSSDGGSPVPLGPGRSGQVLYHTGAVEVQTTVDGFPVRVLAPRADLALYVASTLRPRR